MSNAEDVVTTMGDSKPKLWLLVQCERSASSHAGGGANNNSSGGDTFFDVIEASAVIPSKRAELMHTGKTIEVRIGSTLVKATIFIISDDRTFLENELRQQIASSKTISTQHNIAGDNSSSSFRKTASAYNDSTEKITFSLERNRKRRKAQPVDDCNGGSGNASELSNQSSVSAYNCYPASTFIPPMTFDQQTQTDAKLCATVDAFGGSGTSSICSQQLSTVLVNQEVMLAQQRSIKTECQQTKDQLNAIVEENKTMKAMLAQVLAKLDQQHSQIFMMPEQKPAERAILSTTTTIAENGGVEPVMLFACDSDMATTNRSNQLLDFNSSTNELKQMHLSIEHIEINNDSSNVSFTNNSCSSFASSSSTTAGFGQEIAKSDQVKKVKKFSSAKEMVTYDWTDEKEDIDPMEQIVIGNNQTTVQRWVMDQIKWTSHSHATRKLLTTLFTREVLASHSLTGKPSPAFIDRPTKHQLDPLIIADIIQCVSKRCQVSETAVRCSITTKCADENKMLRQRSSKRARVLQSMEAFRIANTTV